MDYKKSVSDAISKYIERQKKNTTPKRNNARPEKEVEAAVMAWLKSNGFDCQVYESKSKLVNGRWQNAGMAYGNADVQGTDPNGYSVAIELKAPGKRSSFWKLGNDRQQEYILKKINTNGFACVVDSVELLEKTYRTWLKSRDQSLGVAQAYLKDCLPKKPKRVDDESDLFD